MEVPIQIVAAAFVAILAVQGWQVRMLFRLESDFRVLRTTLEVLGILTPKSK